jgi:putative phosphoesterase
MSLIAICSDSHDNMTNIDTFLNYCKKHKVDFIIHCGDVTEKRTKNYFEENSKAPIHFVEGNADISEQQKLKRTNRFMKIKRGPVPYFEQTFDNIRIAACHQRDKAIRLCNNDRFDIVFYGHNHKPWKEIVGKTYMINPGNLAGMFYKATFATYNTITKKLELILLELL